MSEAGSKIILQKRPVSERNFKKHLLKQPFFAKLSKNQQMLISNKRKKEKGTPSETALFCKILHESADDQFQIKQIKEKKIYSKQNKGQL